MVRLSGPRAFACAGALFAPSSGELPVRGGRRVAGQLTLPGWPPAPAAAWTFQAPRSYTGQHVVELVVPGSPPLLAALCAALEASGARLARPGELTRRAFLAGKLDLTQVEAVLTLTTSEDERQARAALRALEGGLAARVDAHKEALLLLLAHLEAAIDFSEEELDLRADAALIADLVAVEAGLAALGRVRGGAGSTPRVVLRGAANAGKSTLLNALCGRAAALVSDQAGTTRDVLAATWTLPGGTPVQLLDTAGLEGPGTAIDRAAGALANEVAAGADLVLFLLDGREVGATPPPAWVACPAPRRLVLTKHDLAAGGASCAPAWAAAQPSSPSAAALVVSARTGEGLAELAAAVEHDLGRGAAPGGDLLASVRQAELLARAGTALARARLALEGGDPARAELAALEVREALDALGALTGEVGTEDVLDRLFARFCVGK